MNKWGGNSNQGSAKKNVGDADHSFHSCLKQPASSIVPLLSAKEKPRRIPASEPGWTPQSCPKPLPEPIWTFKPHGFQLLGKRHRLARTLGCGSISCHAFCAESRLCPAIAGKGPSQCPPARRWRPVQQSKHSDTTQGTMTPKSKGEVPCQ